MGLVDRRPVVCPTLAMGFWVPLQCPCERSALPACSLVRVHRSVPWPGPPRERVKSISPPRGYPSLACHSGPPTPSSAAQQLAARSSQRSAAVRSAAQSIALSDHGSAATVKEVDRPGLPHQRVLSADQRGRTPSRVNHLHNHRPTSTSRTPSPVLRQPLQQPPPGPVR